MRRALLSQGCFGLGLAVYLAHAGCGGDAAGICDFNECVGASVVGVDGGTDGTVSGEAGGEDGSDLDVASFDVNLPDGGLFCGLDASTTSCGDAGCVDTTSSVNNCGACGHVCPAPDAETESAVCSAGACTFACKSGTHLCNGQCLSNADDPSVDPCLVTDAFGVFVVSGGTGTGTQASPLGSIAAAMALAHSSGKGRVFVCAQGSYTSPTGLVVGATATGVAVSGGFTACPTTGAWTYTAQAKSLVAPSAPGLALSVSGASVQFMDMEFDAMDGANPGDSSIAAFVASAPSASFVRSVLKAGAGQAGPSAAAIAPYAGASTSGSAGTATNGGGLVTLTCPNGTGTTVGGAGGPPNATGGNGFSGTPAITPANPPTATGAGGDATAGNCNGGTGAFGSYGPGGASGAGAAANGSVTPSGWSPSGGAAGGNGGVGQGGGGGASLDVSGGGGGGGAGGCGGSGGGPGGAGGSSIALLLYNTSNVTLTSSTVTAAAAGSGGSGGAGQVGQLAGNAGAAASTAECNGGSGGAGGSGGGGGGGAGGVSAAIGWAGTTAPTTTGATLNVPIGFPASGGAAGAGALPAKLGSNPGAAGTAGQVGVVQQVVQLP